MNCKKEQLNITRGSDIILNVTLMHDEEVINPLLIEGLEVNLISGLARRIPLASTQAADYIVVSIPWSDVQRVSVYSLEVKGSINGLTWAAIGKGLIRYTNATEAGADSVTVEADAYDVTMEVGYHYSDSPIAAVHVSVDDEYGTPSADVTYQRRVLGLDFHNLRGNGITEIDVDEQVGDEAVNIINIKTDADPEGTELQVRNGSRGNGIESSSEEMSSEDGGVNTFTFLDTDGQQHAFHSINGHKGNKGDSVLVGQGDLPLTHELGQSYEKAISQKGITDVVSGGEQTSEYNDYLRIGLTNDGFVATTIRVTVRMPYDCIAVKILSVASGYRAAVNGFFLSDPNLPFEQISQSDRVYDSTWQTSSFDYSPGNDVNMVTVLFSKSNDGNITIDEAISNISFTYLTSSMKWDKEIDKVKDRAAFFSNSVKLLPMIAVNGERNPRGTNGISTITSTSTRATSFNYINIKVLRQFSKLVIPEGYMAELIRAASNWQTSNYFTSDFKVGEISISDYLQTEYPFICFNFKKEDNSAFTSSDLAELNSGLYLTKEESGLGDWEGNVIDVGLKTIEQPITADSLSLPIIKGMVTEAAYGDIITSSARATFASVVRPDFLLDYNSLYVPAGYQWAIELFVNTGGYPGHTVNDYTTGRWSTGWMGGGGTFNIAPYISTEYTYASINFRRNDNGNITDSDMLNLNDVVLVRESGTKIARSIVVQENGATIGGIIGSVGSGFLSVKSTDYYDLDSPDYTPVHTELFDLTAHRMFKKWEIPSGSMQDTSPQGSAVFGNYLFSYFADDEKLRIFDIRNSMIVSVVSLGDVGHGNSMQFGEVVQETGFPYLYISGSVPSDDVKDTVYCCLVSLTSATVVRTIQLDSHALLIQNCAFDWHRSKMYAVTMDNNYSGGVKIIRYDVLGLESSTSATFTPIFEDESSAIPFLGVIQGVSFCNNALLILTSDWDETYAKLYFFRGFQEYDIWEWSMGTDSECQGVTPIYQGGRYLLLVPSWWRYASGKPWYYRLSYIN